MAPFLAWNECKRLFAEFSTFFNKRHPDLPRFFRIHKKAYIKFGLFFVKNAYSQAFFIFKAPELWSFLQQKKSRQVREKLFCLARVRPFFDTFLIILAILALVSNPTRKPDFIGFFFRVMGGLRFSKHTAKRGHLGSLLRFRKSISTLWELEKVDFGAFGAFLLPEYAYRCFLTGLFLPKSCFCSLFGLKRWFLEPFWLELAWIGLISMKLAWIGLISIEFGLEL